MRQIGILPLSMLILCCPAAITEDCSAGRNVDVGGYALWISSQGQGTPTVVFESGGGEDSSEWSNIEPIVRERAKTSTVLYDRAGLGKSQLNPGAYRIQDEAIALERALDACNIDGPVVLVAHSYGGFISEIVAATDQRVKGLVLVDANIPSFFDDRESAILKARFEMQADRLRKEKPDLARVLIPILEASQDTARYMQGVRVPLDLAVVDITAEHTWVHSPDEIAAMRRAHSEFVAASPKRISVFAKGSGHYISRDKPEVVIDVVIRLISEIRESRLLPKP